MPFRTAEGGPSNDRLTFRHDPVGPHLVHARASRDFPADGTPLVLVHGLVISSLYMVPTAVRLAERYRVLAPDLPGFGLSSKPEEVLSISALADLLLRWIDVVGLDRAVLIGNSLGCQNALEHRIEEKLPALVAPTLVVRGSRDRIVPQAWAEEVCRLLPHGTLREIPGGPHVVNYTTPGEFTRLVSEFLARLGLANGPRV